MTPMPYVDLADRLTSEAEALLGDMVEAHHKSSVHRQFLVTQTFGGWRMLYPDSTHENRLVDSSALNDLRDYGLLRQTRSTRNSDTFEVSGEGIQFHGWLRSQASSHRSRGASTSAHEPFKLTSWDLVSG